MNVYGIYVLFESVKKVGIKRFIYIFIDEVYGEVKDDDDDLLEMSILVLMNLYVVSKVVVEMLVYLY